MNIESKPIVFCVYKNEEFYKHWFSKPEDTILEALKDFCEEYELSFSIFLVEELIKGKTIKVGNLPYSKSTISLHIQLSSFPFSKLEYSITQLEQIKEKIKTYQSTLNRLNAGYLF